MAHNVYGAGRLGLTGGVGTVRVTIYEANGTVAVAPTTSGVVELPADSGIYLATVAAAEPRRPLWMQFDDQSGQYSLPVQCGILPADAFHINGTASPAERLASSADTIPRGTVDAGATTTIIPTLTLDPAAVIEDQFKGCVVSFNKSTTTAALRGQRTRITGNSAGGVIEVVALTTAPVSGDSFTIT